MFFKGGRCDSAVSIGHRLRQRRQPEIDDLVVLRYSAERRALPHPRQFADDWRLCTRVDASTNKSAILIGFFFATISPVAGPSREHRDGDRVRLVSSPSPADSSSS